MKIGHISTGYKPVIGGQETYIANLFRLLAGDGHSQRVYQEDTGAGDPEIRPVPKLPPWLTPRALRLYAYNALLLTRFADLRSEDLLIAHYGFHALPVLWHRRLVVVSHGVEWEVPPRKLHHRIRRWASQVAFGRPSVRFVANDTNFFRQMGADVPPAQGFFREVLPGRWFIPNCVDVERFRRTDPVPELSALDPILVPRNIVPRRGLHLAVDAFAEFAQSHPATHLVIVGGYEAPGYRRVLEERITGHGLKARVVFWGHVPWEQMPAVFSSGVMTLVPSLFGEGTSLSALESMACGTPAVATEVGGLVDLPSCNVRPDPGALARGMEEVYRRRDEVSLHQQEAVRQTFNLERWHAAWREVIGSSG
ncbi:MAG: glycosyltransferase family 4 protein [Candidatus Eisenbacteria sp.]|nr:glycosyltransferase family 4 protein [Candidatus Eisenbacteria bacterium]